MTSTQFAVTVLVALVAATLTWLYFRSQVEGLLARLRAQTAELESTHAALDASTASVTELQGQLTEIKTEHAALGERLKAEQESFERERTNFESARTSLIDTFRSIGAEVIDKNSAKVAEIAKTVLERENADTRGSFELKEQAIANIVGPVKEQLEKLSMAVGEIERKREGAYGEMTSRLEALVRSEAALQAETSNLSVNTATLMQALKGSGSRGRWGEFTLQRVVEMAGMTEHCEFDKQPTIAGEDGNSRPDMVVHLPGGSFVAVDAKVPMSAYINAMEAVDDVTRNLKRKEHARTVRLHVDELAKRSYIRPDIGTPDFVIMFVPGEGILSSALNDDPDLLEYAFSRKVLFATPTNLIAMLRTIALSWQHKALEEDAAEIAKEGGELYERLAKCGRFIAEMGGSLNRTVSTYNEMVGNLEGRVFTSGRKLRDRAIIVKRGDPIPTLEPIETTARPLTSPEFTAPEFALEGAPGSNGSNGSNGAHGSNGNGAPKNVTGNGRTNGKNGTSTVSSLLGIFGLK